MILNEKQNKAYQSILSGNNVFISGPGGVGKSVIVNMLRENFGGDTVFLAPTGIAALNIKGVTLHRAFGFPLGVLTKSRRANISKKAQKLFGDDTVKRIVIDEISMVRADTLVAIDVALRKIKGNKIPFGGLQVIIVGDFFQLPPVVNAQSQEGQIFFSEFETPYAFDTKSWSNAAMMTVQLDEIMRQNDKSFIFALNSIRQKDSNYLRSLQFLNTIGKRNYEATGDSDMLVLCSTNKDADTINITKFEELTTEERSFRAEITGTFSQSPVDIDLKLKVGAEVLICANNPEEGYCNGTRGIITNISNDTVMVRDKAGTTYNVGRQKWSEYDYDNVGGTLSCVEIGSFTQFPIRLGWAITIHKSQGMTLSEAAIYTGRGCFVSGQAYVAFSRIANLNGLVILSPVQPHEIIVEQRIKDFYDGKIVSANLFDFM